MHTKKPRGNGHNLQLWKFPLLIRKSVFVFVFYFSQWGQLYRCQWPRDVVKTVSLLQSQIPLDGCLTNLIQLWLEWKPPTVSSNLNYSKILLSPSSAKNIMGCGSFWATPLMLTFHRNVEEFNNFTTSVCLSKLVDIMNVYNKGGTKSVGLFVSGNQTKNPILMHVSCTQQSWALCAAQEYVAFHLQRGNLSKTL